MTWFLVLAACGSSQATSVPERRIPPPGSARAPVATASPPQTTKPLLVESETIVGAWAPRATPEEVGLDRVALERLVEACERTDTHALVVIAKGRAVVERRFGKPAGPIDLMSITKGFGGLAVGKLVEQGKIKSIDLPLSTWFPEWKLGLKAKVTLRHVLTHTSGLEHRPSAGELTKQKDRLAYVRALPVTTPPGETFSYSNEATMLLAGVVQKASGKPLDVYVAEELLAPMEITEHPWVHDDAGTPPAFWGLSLDADALARVGATLLAGGRWKGREIVPSAWVDAMQKPANDRTTWHGLLAWLLYDGPWRVQTAASRKPFADAGFPAIDELAPLDGRRFASHAAYWLEAGAILDADERARLGGMIRDDRLPYATTAAEPIGYDFNGWLGQYLVVLPRAGVIAVRLRRAATGDDADNDRNGMRDFVPLVTSALPR